MNRTPEKQNNGNRDNGSPNNENTKNVCRKKGTRKAVVQVLLLLLVVLLTAAPVLFLKNAKFGGSDDQAEKAITEIDKNYKPWFAPIWEPPSSEIESLLFALQAALGAGFVCYFIGYSRGRKKKADEELAKRSEKNGKT